MRKTTSLLIAASTAFAICPASARSSYSVTAPPPPLPPATAVELAEAAPDMQAILKAHASLSGKSIETLTRAKARVQSSAADGAKAVMAKKGMSTARDPAVAGTLNPSSETGS